MDIKYHVCAAAPKYECVFLSRRSLSCISFHSESEQGLDLNLWSPTLGAQATAPPLKLIAMTASLSASPHLNVILSLRAGMEPDL